MARNEFLIRRLHSLSGLIPVGAYMVVHLLTNATVLADPAFFQEQVNNIHKLGPALPIVEWVFIFIPILFHAIIGVVIVRGGLPNTGNYPFVGNVRYTLQRVTGMIAFVFIMSHVLHMHHLGEWIGKQYGFAAFDVKNAASSASLALASVWVKMFYAVGVLASVYHLANGIWTMGITWGVWVSPAAQRRANYFCIAFGLVMAVVGLSALVGFGRVPADSEPSRSPAVSVPADKQPAKTLEGKQAADNNFPILARRVSEEAPRLRFGLV